MCRELGRVVLFAMRSWSKTLRLCLIIAVLAGTTVIPFYLMKVSALPFFMK